MDGSCTQLQPPHMLAAPWLFAMKGHPASGKSAVAHALAQHLRIPLIDKDDIKDVILDLPGANDLAYEIMWQVAATQLALGQSVIAVSPLSYPAGYAHACTLAAENHANLLIIETVLAEAEWRRRLDVRNPADSTHKIRGWDAMQRMLRQYDGCWQYPIAADHHLQIDTTYPIAVSVARVIEHIEA